MKSIKELYRIGTGPSSSHTMGPRKAAEIFLERHPEAASFKVTLYGSLAATGKGHMTNIAITEVLQPIAPVEIIWEPKIFLPFHPNGMKFVSVDKAGKETDQWTVFSIGGGALAEENDGASSVNTPDVYSMSSMTEIMQWCERTGKSYWEYVKECEDSDLWDYLQEVWKTMQDAVKRGLEQEGVLPGPLNLRRKASTYYIRASGYKQSLQSRGLVFAYALAVSEENASGGVIVTAPTCGSCGVMPAVLYHLSKSRDFSDTRILRALATAGLVGNIVKTNASISGAEVGCQGEVGVACAMASAAANQLFGGSPAQIEYAAEMGLEHHLGMTCDPVCGLVQIPCIERNAYAAARALDANLYSSFTDGMHRVSFDKVVAVMKETGNDLPSLYKEERGFFILFRLYLNQTRLTPGLQLIYRPVRIVLIATYITFLQQITVSGIEQLILLITILHFDNILDRLYGIFKHINIFPSPLRIFSAFESCLYRRRQTFPKNIGLRQFPGCLNIIPHIHFPAVHPTVGYKIIAFPFPFNVHGSRIFILKGFRHGIGSFYIIVFVVIIARTKSHCRNEHHR